MNQERPIKEPPAKPKRKRGRLVFWLLVVFLVAVPLPAEGGLWMPLLFQLFEAMNSALPSNF